MAVGENKLIRRRLVGAWLSTVVSISLVLLLVGIAALLVANAGSVSDYFKENMQVSVLMKQEVGEGEAMEYVTALETMPFIKSTALVSREKGTEEMAELLGEDFLNVFETAPIPVSVDVTLKAEYVSSDSLEVIKRKIMKSPLVDEVVYQESLVDKLNTNLRKISLVLGVFIVLLLFISFVLINNTVRLNVFSKRFTIHTMKLVGATKSFIRAPFMLQAVFQGLFSALMATVMLVGILFFVKSEFARLFEVFRLDILLMVIGVVIVTGVAICTVSTALVVGRLLSLSKDELYC